MHFVFWVNMLSPHLAPVMRALGRQPDVRVTVVAETECTARRRALGWQIPDLSGAQIVISPSDDRIDSLASITGIHILGGVHGYELGPKALRALLNASAHFGLISESFESDGFLAPLRRLRARYDRSTFGDRLDFILAIGTHALSWYQTCGYSPKTLFPFGYFPEMPASIVREPRGGGHPVFELMYLGRCASGKGVESLARALHGVTDLPFRCTFLGDGPAEHGLSKIIQELGLASSVRILPAVSWREAMAELSRVDLLVLPSIRKDGWGAVVNEALILGVPVLCSNRCGAADLLSESWRGELVDARSVQELRGAIRRWIAAGKVTSQARQRIRDWAICLEADCAARYLIDVIACVYKNAPRPLPPWVLTRVKA